MHSFLSALHCGSDGTSYFRFLLESGPEWGGGTGSHMSHANKHPIKNKIHWRMTPSMWASSLTLFTVNSVTIHGGSNETVPHRFIYLNIWSLGGGVLWGGLGGTAFLKEIYPNTSQGWALRSQKSHAIPSVCALLHTLSSPVTHLPSFLALYFWFKMWDLSFYYSLHACCFLSLPHSTVLDSCPTATR